MKLKLSSIKILIKQNKKRMKRSDFMKFQTVDKDNEVLKYIFRIERTSYTVNHKTCKVFF